MKVETITHKKEPVYLATVVGKPPIEDKFMGWATERIFLPLLKTTAPDLIDYHMPENGVFHNLILAKIKPHYKGHATQIMHAFWGVGQMSFVKHAIFVDENARGSGVANLLVEAAEAHCRAQGVDQMRLYALANNKLARAYYDKSGWSLYEVSYRKPL